MLTWDEARSIVLSRISVLPQRRVRLEDAAGRVLGEPLIAGHDSPPFAMSSVDGFAVRPEDVETASPTNPVRLRILGTIHAGSTEVLGLRKGTALKIMTGASVPRNAKTVVMKEDCVEERTAVLVQKAVEAGENIRPRGGEFRAGQMVVPAGIMVTPPVMGLLASFGYARVLVHECPTVTVMTTGNELLAPSQPLRPGKIRDANLYALAAAVESLGIVECRTARVKDQPAALRKRLTEALHGSDLLLVAGGMSVGDRDYVRAILCECGVEEQFWQVAVRPGKPAYFGVFVSAQRKGGGRRARRSSLVFGLPGNPVSALVCFHQLVKPALLGMMGHRSASPSAASARLLGTVRKQIGRLEWLRGTVSNQQGEMTVEPTMGQESHMLGGLARANCLIRLPEAADILTNGEQVTVEPLAWHM